MDVGENTTLGDGDTAQKLVQFLVVADSELDVAGHNASLLVVTSGVAGELKNLSSQVSKTEARYTGAPAPTREAYFPLLRYRPILATGN